MPVAAEDSLEVVRAEADAVVCLYPLAAFVAVGAFYRSFQQVDDAEVVRLLGESRTTLPSGQSSSRATGTSR